MTGTTRQLDSALLFALLLGQVLLEIEHREKAIFHIPRQFRRDVVQMLHQIKRLVQSVKHDLTILTFVQVRF